MRPLRGEVWQVNFAPSVGAEIQKIRPAAVLNVAGVGRLPLLIVVPITDWQARYVPYRWIVRLSPTKENGLSKESGADTFQVKSVSESRFVSKLGELTPGETSSIADAIALCVGYISGS